MSPIIREHTVIKLPRLLFQLLHFDIFNGSSNCRLITTTVWINICLVNNSSKKG